MSDVPLSLSEVLAALSHALDLTEGQPPGHTMRSCLIGMRIAESLELAPLHRSHLFYALLLKDAGCSSNAAPVSEFFGSDDHTVKRNLKTVNWTRTPDAALYAIRNAARGTSLPARAQQVVRMARAGQEPAREFVRIRCERGADIARGLGFPDATARAIHALDEHWDGRGHPDGLRGRDIPLLGRICALAQTVEVFHAASGVSGAMQVARKRSGTWFDPDLVAVLSGIERDRAFWEQLAADDLEALVAASEPSPARSTAEDRALDGVAEAFAEIIDAKSPFTHRHSARVARVARALGQAVGLDDESCARLYRAGLLHDIGKLGVSNRILDKRGPLDASEREAMKRHPAHTHEILSRVNAFRDVVRPAARHHEKLDGSGYPWGFGARDLDIECRIMAVADIFEALTADRPYRSGMSAVEALAILRRESGDGVDPDVVHVLGRLVDERSVALDRGPDGGRLAQPGCGEDAAQPRVQSVQPTAFPGVEGARAEKSVP